MKLRQLYILLFCFTLIYACKKQDAITQETDNLFKYRDYISYTSSGLQSVAEPIVINLSKPVEGWKDGLEITEALVRISPYVEGKLKTTNNHTLVFFPDEYLDPATEYSVQLKLDHIYKDIPSEYKDYVFQFKTITPSFSLDTRDLQSYSKHWQYLDLTIKSSDIISLKDAKTLVKASQNGKPLNIHFNELMDNTKFYELRIDSIQRMVDDTEITIRWNGKTIKAENKGENTFAIPGINNFTITNVEAIRSPEQYLLVNFSDPLKKQQNFDGLVSIQNTKTPKYSVDGNVLKVYPESKLVGDIQVDVFQGITNTDGYKLKHPFSEIISFEELKPYIRLISNGTILPNSNDLKFNFEAVNLSAVDVRVIKIFEDNVLQFLQDNPMNSHNQNEIKRVGRRIAKQTIQLQTASENSGKWKAYSIDLSKFFKADPGAIYRVELSYNKRYSLYNCEANSDSEIDNEDAYEDYYEEDIYYDDYYANSDTQDDDLREEAYWDNRAYRYRNYVYNWRQRENPCHDAYYNDSKIVAQNVIASNLGVIAKQGADQSYYFAVTNILNTNPESGATVTLYNYQQQEIGSVTTNSEGLATIEANKFASFAIVSKGKHTSYMRLTDGNSLSLSKFDVSGKRLQRGLKGYIYGERGVWRPGDSLFLTFMLNDKTNPLPKGHPVKLEVTDPNGKLVYRNITSNHVNNFYKFIVPTVSEGTTGNYNAKVSVGGAQFYKALKVETVKPNRLKIKIDFEDAILSNNKPLNGTLDVKWLHGAPAKNIKAEIKAKFSTTYTGFENYKGYIFRDPTKKFNSEELNVFEDTLDENGKATLTTNLDIGKNAPGMLQGQFLVRAFENGGNFSLDAFTKVVSPYDSYVGLRSPEGHYYGSYTTNSTHRFEIATVDKNGRPVKRDSLEVKVYKIEWRWWWNSSYDNLSNYVSSSYHRPVLEQHITTGSNGKTSFDIKIPEEQRGRYLIRVYDPVSGHATGRTAYFYKDWSGFSSGADKEAAKMLVFTSDKTSYNVGETATITFPSGEEGRALISIENGSDVIEHKWVKTTSGETSVQIPITSEMAPNVFVNISLLQPHAITSNDLPLRLYGVIPILVEDPKTILEPELRMASVLRPEQEFEVFVSEKNNKSMTYTIAMVEEGLLDLTRFKTPNAWDEFYTREALGVKTWDIFDHVIGAYSGSIDQVFAIGGDGNAAKGKNKKANRFKPVVTFLGPFELEPGGRASHKLKMPNYIGAVRTMVVAGNNTTEAYGSTDKSVEVKKPLMVLATLPRKLSPGEKVTLPVTVFAMEPKMKQVNLKLNLSDGISVVGNAAKQLSFSKPDEQMAYFELDVSKAKGINTVEVIASGHGETSTYKVALDVINPNPLTSQFETMELTANANQSINFSTFGVPGSNTASVEFSTLPPMDFSKRLQYLIRYPHGCVEQTTSSVFPQLFLSDIFDLKYDKKQSIQANIEQGIKRLGNFQKSHGGLSYWSGEHAANDWGTSYAGHFMIEAEKKGYVLPLTFKSNWLKYQKKAARDWRPSYRHYNSDLAQAYRLYTLALAGSPDLASMNRLREFEEISNEAKWRLAAAYALAGQKEASEKLSRIANINFEAYDDYYTYGSVDRNRAMALETMVLTKDTQLKTLAKQIANALSSDNWMSTQTTAYSLLAMAKLVNANGGKNMNLEYHINGTNETINTKSSIAQRDLNIQDGLNTLTVKNKDSNLVFVRVLNSGKLPLGKELAEKRGLDVLLEYRDLKGNPIHVSKLQQGQDFVAKITVYNTSTKDVNDIALTQIFPSGWEIVNTRFTAYGNTTTNSARYTDIRDDRINFYFDLKRKGNNRSSKTFSVMLNASYLGRYYLPGTQVEAMYDNDFLVRNKGFWIEVIK